MLKNKSVQEYFLQEEKLNANQLLSVELQQYFYPDNHIWQFNYPVLSYPEKVSSVTFDKEPNISGILNGVKGQYLIFSDGKVLNIRKHSGYFLEVSVND